MELSLFERVLNSVKDRILCREHQIQLLLRLLAPTLPNPVTLVVHGLEATGKSSTVRSVLEKLGTPYAYIKSEECITARHLLEQTIATCTDTARKLRAVETKDTSQGSCESVAVLFVQLEQLLRSQEKFILVFDGIDLQREAPPTLLPALARLGHIIPSLTVIFIVAAPGPRFANLPGVPHVHFPPYNRAESITIVSRNPLPISREAHHDSGASPFSLTAEEEEDSQWLWSRYCSGVWDSIAKGAARDLTSFQSVCHRLWRPFIQPILDGTYGPREFPKLMVRNRGLFQDQDVLLEKAVPALPAETGKAVIKRAHDLPYYSKYLIFAAYLASYNPVRQDQVFFMKSSEKKRRKRAGTGVGRTPKHRKIQRKLLGPQSFVLERMFAILQAILPQPLAPTTDIMTQVATLASLRLLVRVPSSADVLDFQTKWKINVGWEYVHQMAKSIRFDIENYIAE